MTNWSEILNIGDEIIVGARYVAEQRLTVRRITPSGQIVTNDNNRFMPDGYEIGGNKTLGMHKHILRKL